MSKQQFNMAATVAICTDAVNNTHTMRALTEMGLTLDSVSSTVRSASNSMAEHYHEIALQIEREQRKKRGTEFKAKGNTGTAEYTSANKDDQETLRLSLAVFRQQVATELAWLKQEKGWEKDKLPGPCDQAIRKIQNGWENNFSLEVLKSCSKVGKANSDREKEKDKELLDEAGIPPASNGELVFECNEEHHAAIKKAMAALDKAFVANPLQAQAKAEEIVKKCDAMVKHATAQLASKAVNQ